MIPPRFTPRNLIKSAGEAMGGGLTADAIYVALFILAFYGLGQLAASKEAHRSRPTESELKQVSSEEDRLKRIEYELWADRVRRDLKEAR